MKNKWITNGILVCWFLGIAGCTESDHSQEKTAEAASQQTSQTNREVDSEVLEMAEKLREALEKAAEAENLNPDQ